MSITPGKDSSGPPPDPGTGPGREGPDFLEVQRSEEFGALRRAHRSFAFPLTVAFIVWYLLYVLLSNYAGGFMGTTVVGNINVAFVFGIAQFVSTFAIAIWYSRHAAAKFDPKAQAVKSRLEGQA